MPRDSDARFQSALALGNLGERLVARWLATKGAGIVPAFDYKSAHGGAPKLWLETTSHVLPDLDVCGPDRRFWLEVKTYHGPAWNHSKRALVHGFPSRLFRAYQAVEEKSHCPVFVGILETRPSAPPEAGLDQPLRPGVLLVAPLARIAGVAFGCQCRACKGGDERGCRAPIKRCTYWPRDVMTPWHTFGEDEISPVLSAMSERDREAA